MPRMSRPSRPRPTPVGLRRVVGARHRSRRFCAAPGAEGPATGQPWEEIVADARGETVDLWMYGGDDRGNAYVDDVLAPAAADLGVTLRRVPVADTREALRRVLAERAAGSTDGTSTWCGSTATTSPPAGRPTPGCAGGPSDLPNTPTSTPTTRCSPRTSASRSTAARRRGTRRSSPWPTTARASTTRPRASPGCWTWAAEHPGRFTYPAPPDFTGSVFVRQALYGVSGGAENVPTGFEPAAFDDLTPALWHALSRPSPPTCGAAARRTRATRPRSTGSTPTARST